MPHGRLEVICGPMFAGKTTELVRRLRDAQGRGERVVAIKPSRDTRYRTTEISTHTGETFAATQVADAEGILGAAGNAQVVAIDELHFFGAAASPVCVDFVRRGVRVIVAGVERDHLGRPFEPFPAPISCEADEVVKLSGPTRRMRRAIGAFPADVRLGCVDRGRRRGELPAPLPRVFSAGKGLMLRGTGLLAHVRGASPQATVARA